MDVYLADGVQAQIILDAPVRWTPKWALREGHVSSPDGFHSHDEAVRAMLASVGGINWLVEDVEGLAFDAQTLLLNMFALFVPESVASLDTSVFDTALVGWLQEPITPGTLKLLTPQGFELGISDWRWMNAAGTVLVCGVDELVRPAGQRLRLRIAADLDLLFADGVLRGWSLLYPARTLVVLNNDPTPEGEEQQLSAFLKEYIELLIDPIIDRMNDGDPSVLKALQSLDARLVAQTQASPQREVLRAAIADVIHKFY